MAIANVKIVRDDSYEEIAAAFQTVEIAVLDSALIEAGVVDVEVRKKVCESFAFGIGNVLDQYWFKSEGVKYHPILCFSKSFLNTDTDLAELGTIYAPSPYFSFHEYALGAVEWYYGDRPEGETLEYGCVAEAEPAEDE